jgi:hypothetical protein
MYEGLSISFWTGRLELELQMVQLSAARCSCIAILCVSLVSFATITLYVASRVFVVINLSTQCGNFWIHPCNLVLLGEGLLQFQPILVAVFFYFVIISFLNVFS